MDKKKYEFPKDFIWGAATASYQIEGGWNEDGTGESIWDRFSHTPGKVQDGDTGDVACDHYHRWEDDLEMIKKLGLKAYRFSVAWPRVLPNGSGMVSEAGLDFYNKLVDCLLKLDIEPYITLYHWDLPQKLQDKGGWPSRDIVEPFVEYADIVTRALGDRVKNWITFNEPWVSAFVGYEQGRHAPGHTHRGEALAASHHLLLSHGKAVPVIRANSRDANVGITLNLTPKYPASPSIADRDAATWDDGYLNRWFLDPLTGRGYPADMVESFGDLMFPIQPGDMKAISVPLDFIGVNYYTRNIVRSDKISEAENAAPTIIRGDEITEMDWEVYPEGLYKTLGRLYFDYDFPVIHITENGAAFVDTVNADGEVDDPARLSYIERHLKQVHRAIEAGIPVKGYFAWSLMDNFEWGFGYSKRFGLVYVDYETQKRIIKSSAKWYREIIAKNAVEEK
ncbi:MAG: beta-glucosidase [Anaerolineales bacterium]|nr:beta-glucosidase [Anaerolineales bacterium]